jgi:hypothetical protein
MEVGVNEAHGCKVRVGAAGALVLALSVPCHAEAAAGERLQGWELGLKASTLGGGVEVRKALGEQFAVRGVLNGYSYSLDEDYSDVQYEGDLDLRSGGLLLDWHPGGFWFRLSAGALVNGNELNLDAEPMSGTYEFNGVEYAAAQIGSATGTAEFDDIAPYLGIGFAKAPAGERGLAFSVDVGVLFQGAPSFDLQVNCGTAVPVDTCAQIRRDADAERAQFEDDADDFEYYPVISVGVGYRF